MTTHRRSGTAAAVVAVVAAHVAAVVAAGTPVLLTVAPSAAGTAAPGTGAVSRGFAAAAVARGIAAVAMAMVITSMFRNVSRKVKTLFETDDGGTLVHEMAEQTASEATWAGICLVDARLLALRSAQVRGVPHCVIQAVSTQGVSLGPHESRVTHLGPHQVIAAAFVTPATAATTADATAEAAATTAATAPAAAAAVNIAAAITTIGAVTTIAAASSVAAAIAVAAATTVAAATAVAATISAAATGGVRVLLSPVLCFVSPTPALTLRLLLPIPPFPGPSQSPWW